MTLRMLLWVGANTLLLLLSSCYDPQQEVHERVNWYESRIPPINTFPGRNYCMCNLRRYPDIGFINYRTALEQWNRESERDAIRDAVDRCRLELGRAYRDNRIRAWESKQDIQARGGDPRKEGPVPFQPRLVVITIENLGTDWQTPKEEQIASPEKGTKVGYVFEAAELFDADSEIETVLQRGFRDEEPLHYDYSQERPADWEVYDILDRYQRTQQVE